MPLPTRRPAADPLDDIDRTTPVDSIMERQDRADIPGERSDQPNAGDGSDRYVDATREVSRQSQDADEPTPDDREPGGVATADEADIDLMRENLQPAEAGRGADDDDPIDETERAGDDAIP